MLECKITNVNIVVRPMNQQEGRRVLGFAEVIIDNSFVVRNIKILKGNNNSGKFIAFPSQVTKDSKKRYDICYPINKETRKYFETVIINAYDKIIEAQPKQ
jgi:DNA-binding cell septation regulator SpoVG